MIAHSLRNGQGRQRQSIGHLRISRPTKWPSTVAQVLGQYYHHLHHVAGLTTATCRGYLACIQQFLQWRFGWRSPRFHALKAKDLSVFIQSRSVWLKPCSLRALATALRSFLRFLHFTGRTKELLAGAVLCPPPWPHSSVPETLSEAQLRTFLKSFDRTQPIGRRDFAMALCLCRLGMRALEVASLQLKDLDWHAHTMHLRHTKIRRGRLLPLPSDVAKAIRGYLQAGRPATDSPALFVRHRAPWCEGQGSELVRSAMRAAFERCGMNHNRVHILRHTVATRLHRRGVNLKVIADLLGHLSLDTTVRYARVNLDELRQAALPWPARWR
jgi:integrase/recombinase XerD